MSHNYQGTFRFESIHIRNSFLKVHSIFAVPLTASQMLFLGSARATLAQVGGHSTDCMYIYIYGTRERLWINCSNSYLMSKMKGGKVLVHWMFDLFPENSLEKTSKRCILGKLSRLISPCGIGGWSEQVGACERFHFYLRVIQGPSSSCFLFYVTTIF